MAYFCIILVAISLQLCEISGEVSYMTKDEVSNLRRASGDFGILVVSNKDDTKLTKAISSLNAVESDLMSIAGIKLSLLNCANFPKTKYCQQNPQRMVLLEDNRMTTEINLDLLQTTENAQAYIIHLMFPELLREVTSKKDAKNIQSDFDGNVIQVFTFDLGSQDHYKILRLLINIGEDMRVCWISDVSLFNLKPNDFKGVKAFTLECNDGKCSYMGTSVNSLENEDLQLIQLPSSEDESSGLFLDFVKKRHTDGENTFILFAGKGKLEKAKMLAEDIGEKIPCRINAVSMNDPSLGIFGSYFENGKIFATYGNGSKDFFSMFDIGFLNTETVEEFEIMWTKAKMSEDKIENTVDFNYPYEQDEISVMDTLDDPMMFGIHTSKKMKNFYLYDYRSMSRLSDKTYPAVISGNDYAVILVTLEFNPRALGALGIFREIHDELFADGNTKSYMHRLECYDWTFVCQNSNYTTTPRMFFYNPDREVKMTEYKGMWDKQSMHHAIMRNKLGEIFVMENMKDFKELPDYPFNIVASIFKDINGAGVETFRQAAIKYPQYLFIEARGNFAKELKGLDGNKVKDGSILAVKNFDTINVLTSFEQADDIAMFAKNSFEPTDGQLFELTIRNYNNVLKCTKPLVIYFHNDDDAMEMMKAIAMDDKIVNDYKVSWMNSAKNSVGHFVANKYNTDDAEPPLIAFNNKKEVWVKSIKSASKQEIVDWILACQSGKGKNSYIIPEEEWLPRLDGYDFLQKLKDENKYPHQFRQPKMMEKEEESGGSRLKSHKQMKPNMEMEKQGKSQHTEL